MNKCPICKGTGKLPEKVDRIVLKSSVRFKRQEIIALEEILIDAQDREDGNQKNVTKLLARLYRPLPMSFELHAYE